MQDILPVPGEVEAHRHHLLSAAAAGAASAARAARNEAEGCPVDRGSPGRVSGSVLRVPLAAEAAVVETLLGFSPFIGNPVCLACVCYC